MSIELNFLTPGGALSSPLFLEMLTPPAVRRELALGARIGVWRIQSELGRGGMALVYLAERADGAFEQQVALKWVGDESRSGDERLIARERQFLARLDHPSIARLIDGGQDAEGRLWFAMEYVDGERIDRYADQQGLNRRQRLELFLQLCSAVAFAHARLLVHRDIKPSNVLVTRDGRVKLLDFGIAGFTELDEDIPQAGTPGYIAPEQLRGDAAHTSVDIYQLGCMLSILLKPASGPQESTALQSEGPTSKPAGATTSERVPEDLTAIIARATAEAAVQRYPTAEALRSDVERFLRDRPVAARPAGAGYVAGLFVRRHRTAVIVAAIGVTLFIATVAGFVLSLERSRARAVSAAELAQREARKSQRISDLLISVFALASPNKHRGKPATVAEVLAEGAKNIPRDLADEPALRAELEAQIGRVYLTIGDYAAAAPLLESALSLGRTDSGLPPHRLADRLRMLAVAYSNSGNQHKVKSLLTEALQLIANDAEAPPTLHNGLLRNLALELHRSGDTRAAIARQQEALELSERRLGPKHPAVASNLMNLGQFLMVANDHSAAADRLRLAFELSTEIHGTRHPETIIAGSAYGLALLETGDTAGATRQLEGMAEVTRLVHGEHSAQYPLIIQTIAYVALRSERYEEAVSGYRQALKLVAAQAAENDINSVAMLQGLGDALYRLDRHEEALAAFAEMLERNRGGAHALDPDFGHRPMKYALALAALGRCDEAIAQRAKALELAAAAAKETALDPYLKKLDAQCATPN